MSDRIARQVVVHGRVQGVFFRASCAEAARSRGVAGWAENQPDGTVAVWLEGEAGAVESMIAWCRHGPPRAEVSGVDVADAEPRGLSDFATG